MTKLRVIMLKEQCPKIYRFFYKPASVGANNRLNHSPPFCWQIFLNIQQQQDVKPKLRGEASWAVAAGDGIWSRDVVRWRRCEPVMNVSWLDWAGGYTIYTIYLQPPTVVQDSQDFCLDIFSGQFLIEY